MSDQRKVFIIAKMEIFKQKIIINLFKNFKSLVMK